MDSRTRFDFGPGGSGGKATWVENRRVVPPALLALTQNPQISKSRKCITTHKKCETGGHKKRINPLKKSHHASSIVELFNIGKIN